jgi:endonuclease/exonuclease/phosphatase (EEP) superfamily protein YafD
MKKKTKKPLSIGGIIDLMAIGLAVATLFGFLGGLWWFFDLFSHFRVQYMQLCLVLIGIALWKRLNKRAVALILLACLNYAFVLPLYFGKPAAAAEKPIRAMLMNLNALNGNAVEALEAISNTNPDLLLLEEVTPKWAQELAILDNDYEYRIAEPQEGCFGIMLLSKYPLKNGSVVDIGSAGVPSITADVYFPKGELAVIGTHPVPPIGRERSKQRNDQLTALPVAIDQLENPVLLIGDLNTTPWSPHFTRLVRESGLRNSMKGFGFQPTWPVGIPWLKIPLDHVLHSPEITIHNRMVGPNVGSDHFPVIIDFSIR